MPAPKSNDRESSYLWRISGLGTELAFGIIGMVLLGVLLDWWLQTSPWFLVILTVLGVTGAGYNFIRQAMKLSREADTQYRAAHPQGRGEKPDDTPERIRTTGLKTQDSKDDLEFPPDFDKY